MDEQQIVVRIGRANQDLGPRWIQRPLLWAPSLILADPERILASFSAAARPLGRPTVQRRHSARRPRCLSSGDGAASPGSSGTSANAIKTSDIGRKNSGNSQRVAYGARRAEALHRPPGTLQNALETQISCGDNLVVPVRHRPFDDAGEHHQRGLVERPWRSVLVERSVDTKARAFDHAWVSVQTARWQELRKGIGEQLSGL